MRGIGSSSGTSDAHTLARGAGLNVLLAAGSGALTSLAFAPVEWWPVALVSLVPLLIALHRTTALRAAGWLALIWGIAFHATSVQWLAAIFGSAVPAIFVLISLPWYLFGLGYRFVQRGLPALAAIATPVLWLAVDWIRSEGWYFEFSWAQLGLAPVQSLSGLYPFIGVYGVTFAIVLVNAMFAAIILRPPAWRSSVAFGAAAIAALGLLPHAPRDLAADPQFAAVIQHGNGGLDELAAMTREAADRGATLIAWPETAVQSELLDDPDLREWLSGLAREVEATLVVGGWQTAPEDAPIDRLRRHAMQAAGKGMLYNSALVIAPDVTILGSYHKTHPIQFFADGVPGREFPVFDTPAGRLGVAICYDFDYAATVRKLVQGGAEVLVVPTVDSEDWPEMQHVQHARIAQARAAEANRPVIRPAMSGISQIIGPGGDILASIPAGKEGLAVAPYPLVERPRTAWPWLPHLCLGLSLLLTACAWAGNRTQAAKSEA